MRPKLLRAFADRGARDFYEKEWLRHINEASNKTRFEYCEVSKHSVTYFRAIQGHTGGITITPQLMKHVICVPQGCSFNINFILENRLSGARRDDKPSSSHLSTLFGENPDEEALSDDFTMPRKVHYHSNWQDAVYWSKLSRAQDQGLRFWQTKSSAIIVHNPVPANCACTR